MGEGRQGRREKERKRRLRERERDRKRDRERGRGGREKEEKREWQQDDGVHKHVLHVHVPSSFIYIVSCHHSNYKNIGSFLSFSANS